MNENGPRFFEPPPATANAAFVSGMAAYDKLVAEADANPGASWSRLAREFVSRKTPFSRGLDDTGAPFLKWFEDGTLNASYNRLDRNVERGLGDKTAILFEADDIRFGDNLPKTRSGKIIRRLLRSIAKGEAITQDISSLENPAVLGHLSERN